MKKLAATYPADPEAEQTLLGEILFCGSAFGQVADRLSVRDFADPAHGAIWEAMAALFQSSPSQPIDLVTVGGELRRTGRLALLGARSGVAYLATLANEVASADHVSAHADIVFDKALRRRLAIAAEEIRRLALGDSSDYLEAAQQLVFEVQQGRSLRSILPIKGVVQEVLADVLARYEAKQDLIGVPSGLADLDHMTAGFQPGELIILAARPSMGKTALAINIAVRASLSQRVPCLIFSLEMSAKSLVERMLCGDGNLDSHHLRVGRLGGTEWRQLHSSAERIAQAPITLNEDGGIRMAQIRAICRRWRTNPVDFPVGTKALGLVVVDYLQLMDGDSAGRGEQNRVQEITRITRAMKALAKELQVPVLLLSQLNRSLESRQDKRPIMSDLRESGAIEQDADVILFVHRESQFDRDASDTGAELIVAKHRNGRTGTIDLHFAPASTRFDSVSRRTTA